MRTTDKDETQPIRPEAIDEDQRRRIEAMQARFSRLMHEPTRPRVARLTIGELTYREDFRGFQRMNGYLALGLGLFMISGLLCDMPSENQSGGLRTPMDLVKVAAACLAAAAVFLLGRRERTFDRAGGQVTLWWGVLGPWRRRHYNLLDYNAVQVTPEIRQSKTVRYLVYRVELVGPRTETLKLWTLRIQADAEAVASEVAEFLGWPVTRKLAGS